MMQHPFKQSVCRAAPLHAVEEIAVENGLKYARHTGIRVMRAKQQKTVVLTTLKPRWEVEEWADEGSIAPNNICKGDSLSLLIFFNQFILKHSVDGWHLLNNNVLFANFITSSMHPIICH